MKSFAGRPVAGCAKFFSIEPANLIVVHDELDLDFGAIRLKLGGGEGGHNGLRSISSALGTKDYLRVRVGIGRPPGGPDKMAKYVLERPGKADGEVFRLGVLRAADAVETLLAKGLEAAMREFHVD